MIDKVFVTNRMMVLQLCLGMSNIYRMIFKDNTEDILEITKNKYKDEKFILISCFGNRNCLISEEPNGKPTPHVLINNVEKVNNLKALGMVDYINVYFDDVTPEYIENLDNKEAYTFELFKESDVLKIIEFVESYIHTDEKVNLLVHCDAGISRSGAVAVSLCEMYDLTKEYIHKHIKPNEYVLKMFKDTVS